MITLTSAQVRSLTAAAMPHASIRSVALRTGGELSTVLEITFEGRGVEPVILKVYDNQWAWKQAKEIHVYGLLERALAGAVPTVLHAETGDDDRPAFTVMTKLEGFPVSEMAVGPDDWRSVYRQLGGLLRIVHGIPQPAYGYLTTDVLDPLPDNLAYMSSQFTKKLREFTQLGGSAELHRKIEAYVHERRHLLQGDRPALCHNDLHEGNVLVVAEPDGAWKVTGFVDVENAIAADPILDLAKTNCYSIRGNRAKLDGLIDGYGALPQNWRQRDQLYRLYHGLELWDWFASIGTTTPLKSIQSDLDHILDNASAEPPTSGLID